MARFNYNEVDNYGGHGGSGFFQLRNDKEVARVRFLYNGIEDVQGDSVHQVEIDGKKRYVNCLRAYKDPVDVCPFCREKMYTQAKLFIPLYNIDEDKVQIWERGKTFFSKMSSICSRYPNLVSHVFDIERNGKPKETTTRYEIYPVSQDDTTLDDFTLPKILGGLILDKTAEDMEYYLDEGVFPPDDEEEEEAPVRRRSESRTSERRPARRTPAVGDSDKF